MLISDERIKTDERRKDFDKKDYDANLGYRILNRKIHSENIPAVFREQSRYKSPTQKRGIEKAHKSMMIRKNNEKSLKNAAQENSKNSKHTSKVTKKTKSHSY